jgi:hypothetical protein
MPQRRRLARPSSSSLPKAGPEIVLHVIERRLTAADTTALETLERLRVNLDDLNDSARRAAAAAGRDQTPEARSFMPGLG